MPAALRASSSSSANGLEGAHVNFLLNVGHSLHGQCQALSTKCLARAFELASGTGCKVARPDVRKSCKHCFTSNQDAEHTAVSLSARQVSRRKARASARIKQQGVTQAEAQAMQARYGSASLLARTCQVCGETSTWPQHANWKNGQVVPNTEPSCSLQQKIPAQSGRSASTAAGRASKEQAINKTASEPGSASAPLLPEVEQELQERDITDRKSPAPRATPDDTSPAKPSVPDVQAPQEHRLAAQDLQSILPVPPPSAVAEDTTMLQPAPNGGKIRELPDGVKCERSIGTTTTVTPKARKRKKKQGQHQGVGVRMSSQGAGSDAGSCQVLADETHGQDHTSINAGHVQQHSSTYMSSLRAKLLSTKKVPRTLDKAGVKKKGKQKKLPPGRG